MINTLQLDCLASVVVSVSW